MLGRAGAGKTQWCVDEARQAMQDDPWGPPLILLVPEQATHQTERALLAGGRAPAAVRARVLSFRRLAAAVLDSAGSPAGTIIDGTGRQMLLASLVEEIREQFGPFAASARRPGFVSRLALTLAEMSAQQVEPAALARAAERLGSDPAGGGTLQGKLADVSRLLGLYRQRIHQLYVDPYELLDLAADRLRAADWLRGARVWVDGFAGLTPQEYGLLAGIATEAEDVWVALCLDPGSLGAGGSRLFAPTTKTYWRLRTFAAQRQIPLGPTVCLPAGGQPTRFGAVPPLAYLEQWFGGAPAAAPPATPAAPPARGAIRLVSTPDQRREVAAAAAEMLRLSRERGYAWRDMALIVPNLSQYHDLLRLTMAEYGIPAFVDRRQPVPHHPLVELVRSSVEIALHDWRPDGVFRWLKTDLGPLGRGDVDVLENYVLAHGIRGRGAWTAQQDWTYWAGSAAVDRRAALLELVNRSRRIAGEMLAPCCQVLQEALRTPQPVGSLVEALVDLLDRAGTGATLAGWSEQAQAVGRPDEAQEHVEVWRGVSSVLAQAHLALGQRSLRLDEFAAVLDAGLESLTLGLVPPSLDQVVCGSIERSRQPELRAMFILGAGQGSFPGRPPEDLVFDDAERHILAGAGIELADPARERSFHEEYLTYIAVTRASEFLWISWSERGGGSSDGAGPSPLIPRLRAMFSDLDIETPSDLDLVWRPEQLARGLARELAGLRDRVVPATPWLEAYQWLIGAKVSASTDVPLDAARACRDLRGLSWHNQAQELGPALARQMWDRPVRGSASRFERFEACAFAHFAAYGLRLAPRAKQEIRAPEMGTFYHAVLQAFYRHLGRDGVEPGTLSPEELSARLIAAVDETAPLLSNEMLMNQGRYRYLKHILHRTLRRTLDWLDQHDQRSLFRPVGLEQGFGFELSTAGPVDVAGINLRGVIDRLDLAETPDGRQMLRIMDYKSGHREFKLANVAHGLDLQLLTYLLAVETVARQLGVADAEVAALLLFPVQDPLIPAGGPVDDQAEQARAKRWRPSGLILAEPAVLRLLDQSAGQGDQAPLLGVRLTKDGAVSGTGAITAQQFAVLRAYLEARISSIASQLAAGRTAIRPWRRGTYRACTYCDYHALCGFDPRLPGNSYRNLGPLSQPAAWAEIDRVAAGGELVR